MGSGQLGNENGRQGGGQEGGLGGDRGHGGRGEGDLEGGGCEGQGTREGRLMTMCCFNWREDTERNTTNIV